MLSSNVSSSPKSFSHEDIATLAGWGAVASKRRWFAQADDEGGLISQTDAGQQYAVLAYGSPPLRGTLNRRTRRRALGTGHR
jgi:hypothetical protein